MSTTHATTYCVGADTDFFEALNAWYHADPNDATVIALEQGSYGPLTWDTGQQHDLSAIDIEGGYEPGFNCSASHRSMDPSTTKLNGAGMYHFSIAINRRVTVSVVEFDGFGGTSGDNGVTFESDDDSNPLLVNHLISRANTTVSLVGKSVVASDILVTGQPSGREVEAIGISATSGTATATNLTVADNLSGGLQLGEPFGDREVFVFNSILWNNAGSDVATFEGTTGVAVFFSILGSASDGVDLFNTMNVDPRFANPAQGDYHLDTLPLNLSPAINAGATAVTNGLPATDIEGNPRIQGGTPDMGAYESDVGFHASYIVTTTADNGDNITPVANSLRWAMVRARSDAAGAPSGTSRKEQIVFNLPCSSTIVIPPGKPLPNIDFDLSIDATSNPGWEPNTQFSDAFDAGLCVGLAGNAAVTDGLRVVAGGRVTVSGLRFGGFTDAALRLDAGTGNVIAGNQIGGLGVGPLNLNHANHDGVRITGSASGTVVGAFDDVAGNNQIGDASGVGVYIDTAAQNVTAPNYVVNNLIGLGTDGHTPFVNGDGIYVSNSPSAIIEHNTIAASTGSGITLSGAATQNTIVALNNIGTSALANCVGNGTYGVLLNTGAAGNTIGAGQDSVSGGNVICNASGNIAVYVSPTAGTGNRILANSIIDKVGIGIDLGAAGPTPNDSFDGDSGPNALQNYPGALHAYRTLTGLWLEGVLDSTVNATYRLDVYWGCCTMSGRGTPNLFLGKANIGEVNAGTHFWVRVKSPQQYDAALGIISATATDAAGNTSEIGNAVGESTDMIFRDDIEVH